MAIISISVALARQELALQYLNFMVNTQCEPVIIGINFLVKVGGHRKQKVHSYNRVWSLRTNQSPRESRVQDDKVY